MELVFVTNNQNKVREIEALLEGKFNVKRLADIGFSGNIEETAETLEGNALLKARHIADRYQCDCFADDTGLEIAALNGRPGVYTARYAGPECSPDDNMEKVLSEMEGVTDRSARFRTVIALIWKGKEYLFEGIVEGEIAEQKSGAEGFGYDPVFLPEGDERTFAEMPLGEKNTISHRGRAVRKLVDFLNKA